MVYGVGLINFNYLRQILNSIHIPCYQEKYGPKGLGKASNGVNTKPQNDAKKKPEVDINVGLSERPPWFCRHVFLLTIMVHSHRALLVYLSSESYIRKMIELAVKLNLLNR